MPAAKPVYTEVRVVRISDTQWEWHGRKDGRSWLVTAGLHGGQVYVEEGPEDGYARRHESGGGSCPTAQFIVSPPPWTLEFPDLHAAVVEALRGQ